MQRQHPAPTGQRTHDQLYTPKVSWHFRHRVYQTSVLYALAITSLGVSSSECESFWVPL